MLVDLAPVVVHELRVVGSRCGDLAAPVQALAAERVADGLAPLVAGRAPR